MIQHKYTTILSDEGKYVPWVQLVNPRNEAIDSILQKYPMPRDFITSGLDRDERARYEVFENKDGDVFLLTVFLYPIVRRNSSTQDHYDTLPIAIVVADDVIITTSLEHPEVLNKMEALPDRIEKQFTSSLSWVIYLLWLVSKDYIRDLKVIRSDLEEMERSAMSSTDNSVLYETIAINKALIYFDTAIEGNSLILAKVEEDAEIDDLSEEQTELLRDVQVEHSQASNLIKQYKEIAEKLSDMLNNVINNNMNKIMKRLTDWTILLTIPTIISGIWGMNVGIPMQDNPNAFWILTVITLVLSVIVFRWLKNRNYW